MELVGYQVQQRLVIYPWLFRSRIYDLLSYVDCFEQPQRSSVNLMNIVEPVCMYLGCLTVLVPRLSRLGRRGILIVNS